MKTTIKTSLILLVLVTAFSVTSCKSKKKQVAATPEGEVLVNEYCSGPEFFSDKKTFKANTNPHGEHRAYVVTGQYEKVMPMDIMPQQLIKSIIAKDLEQMENLGIYEVIEEDMALCEFVCTSKIDVQRVLSEGLELMAEES